MKGLLLLLAVALAGTLLYLTSAGEEPAPPSLAIFERAATARDRAPQDESASALRTQEQTGDLRFAGEFRGHRVYVGRDGTGWCLFTVHAGSTGTGCGPGPIQFKQLSSPQGGETVAFVVVPDGMKHRVHAGRASEIGEMENVLGVAFRGPLTLRFEGRGREAEVELAG